MITSPRDYVFFTIDKEYADKIGTASGFELDLIISGDPGQEYQHVREFGTVVSVPLTINSRLNTTMDLCVGDKIYFHFHTVDTENKHEVDGKVYYKVYYGEIYCAVRDGEIIMLNDYVFCEPVMETEEDIKSPGGIFLKVEPEPMPLRAKVTYMAKAPNNSFTELNIGDHIYYSKHSDIPIEIEGQKFYRMKKDDIVAKYLPESVAI